MKTWNQLFVRFGWLLEEEAANIFNCEKETEDNVKFLLECLERAGVVCSFNSGRLVLPEKTVSEEAWIKALDIRYRGRTGNDWFRPGEEEVKLRILDVYIAGIVRQFNRLGFFTSMSCDGHGRRTAFIDVAGGHDMEKCRILLEALGLSREYVREEGRGYKVRLPLGREELLDLAWQLSLIREDWSGGDDLNMIDKNRFFGLLEELLSIPGASGSEGKIRDYVINCIKPYVDHVTADHAGNILAEKTYRSGHGPVILLNAHLDTIFEPAEDREIIKEGSVWSSSEGILGADDRAGVAVLLHTARHLRHSNFCGKVKYIFTVKEECGLVGARSVNDYFLWGTDAAIVVDRRGKGDIVTSCGGFIPFCHSSYGKFFEKTAVLTGLHGWRTTAGGSSDTRIWAEHGIQSVNLSAGYLHEHTEWEQLDIEACYQTFKLVMAVFSRARELRQVLHEIKREQRRAGAEHSLVV